MNRTRKWRMPALGAASALSVAGLAWLVWKVSGGASQWASAAAGSPLAVRCIAVVGAGVAVLGLLAAVLLRARPGPRPSARGFHTDQGGTAAIEMAFVLPLGLMVFLIVIQAALLFNANMVVHYAAFMAARMATVVVPMDINDEERNLVYGPDQGVSEKRERIRRAAVMALLPISAKLDMSRGSDVLPGWENDIDAAARQALRSGDLADADMPWWTGRVKRQYYYADAYTEIDIAPPDHWQDGDPDPDCPYRYSARTDEWTDWGWVMEPRCPYYHRDLPIWDYYYWEDLDVTMTYQFLLEVPYASRFLGHKVTVPGRSGTSYGTTIGVLATLSNEGGPELRAKDWQR